MKNNHRLANFFSPFLTNSWFKALCKTLLSGYLLIFSLPGLSADWSSTSLLLLNGSGYKNVSNNSRFDTQVLTLEHVDGWRYGSNFFFVDVTDPNSASSNFYGEFSPSLSLSKLTGKDFSFGFVKDTNLTATWEMGQVSNAKLFGLGFDLSVPKFTVAKLNLYQRYSESIYYPGKTGSAIQATIVWALPFNIASTNWLFDGFLDYALEEKDLSKTENIVSSPRLMMDAGTLWGSPKQLYVGMEYSYWKNKYGVQGVNENVPQAAIKWTF